MQQYITGYHLIGFDSDLVGALEDHPHWQCTDPAQARLLSRESDEEGTLERLKALRRELFDPKIAEHRGRIVKTTGDGLLVEFPSVVDAVRCAVAVQQAMPERNAGFAADNRIEWRIGINLGDVIVEGDDLYGDGVNIAARVEVLADPGGVFVSNTVHDHVRDRLPFVFEDLGEQQVKNRSRWDREFADSPLEEAGFELSVPPERKAFPRALDRFRRPSLRAPWEWERQTSARWRRVSLALFDVAGALVPGNGGADMIWASALACSGDFLLRLAACQGKDLIAEARRAALAVSWFRRRRALAPACPRWSRRSSAKTKHPLFSDPAVGHALRLLVDRASIQAHIYGGTGVATGNFINSPERFVSKNTKWEFSVDKANQLLDEAGWTRGPSGIRAKEGKKLKLVFQTSINASRQKTQAIVKQVCQKAGIDVELKSVTPSVYFSSDAANPDTARKFYADT
jgi:hypothetical protein